MGNDKLDQLIRQVASTLRQSPAGDGELLDLFVRHRDESAFEALLLRHGPMVLGVCRRVLGDHHDAEDAFQATFLVLARKASSIRSREGIASWLHGVARRTALQARKAVAKRKAREAMAMPRREEASNALLGVLDAELACLPKSYREVIVLCDLEGEGRKEAAERLGCPEGTVASRLARARAMLTARLSRHGLLVPALLSPSVPVRLAVCATRYAVLFVSGSGAVPAGVTALAQGVLRAMLTNRLTKAALLFLVILLAAGAGVAMKGGHTHAGGPAGKRLAVKAIAPPRPDEKAKGDAGRGELDGSWVRVGDPPERGLASDRWIIAGEKVIGLNVNTVPGGNLLGGLGGLNGQVEETVKIGAKIIYQSSGKLKIHPSHRPRTIDISFTGGLADEEPMHGIYEFKGNTLKVRLTSTDNPRPKEFNPVISGREQEDQELLGTLLVFRRKVEKVASEKEIITAYMENEALFDETINNRPVAVTGHVRGINRHGEGYALAMILPGGSGARTPLRFVFLSENRKELAKLKVGQRATVKGWCEGKDEEAIVFSHCQIVNE